MSIYDRPAKDAPVFVLADLTDDEDAPVDIDFIQRGHGQVVLHIEDAGGGVLAVLTGAGTERVWTVTTGQEIPVGVKKVLNKTSVDVDGYPAETATDVAKFRAYVQR